MKTNIKDLIKELKSYNKKSHEEIFEMRIQQRLDKSLKEYYDQLSTTLDKLYEYADNHDNLKLVKKLNKEL